MIPFLEGVGHCLCGEIGGEARGRGGTHEAGGVGDAEIGQEGEEPVFHYPALLM